MTPTSYVKEMKRILDNDEEISTEIYNRLTEVYDSFTHSQQTFCAMAIHGEEEASSMIKKQKKWA
jgi:DNA gyrase/topoisomerase IV subunit A